MMKSSVVIPAKNAEKTIAACLEAVLHQDGMKFLEDYEVILVDDGSTDDTAEIAKSFEGVRVISQENAGPASARNRGANEARGEILVFTDSDCVPHSSWLKTLLERFVDPEVVGVKGAYSTNSVEPVPRFVQIEYEYKYERLKHQKWIDFIDTYSAAYRRNVFIENGGFDTVFPIPSVEDQEFSFRLARKGYRLVFEPSALVSHNHDKNLREYFVRKFWIGYWKAVMLNWLPEKAFHDSHTLPSQRWQIFLLGIILLGIPLVMIFPDWLWGLIFVVFCFWLSSFPFLKFLWSKDFRLFPVSLVLIPLRALAQLTGIIWGILRKPKIHQRKGLNAIERFIKRSVDILGAIVGLGIFFPLLALCALAIKIDSPGPVFFIQWRAGENGKPFRMIKLRTMVVEAEKYRKDLEALCPRGGLAFKLSNDPRVTRVGRFLRRWSIDELPQFWNVLKGEMSLVGPRPEECAVVARYSDQERQRLIVKPGMTGPMQVSGRGDLDISSRLRLELDYIEHYSLWKDITLLAKTIPAVIKGDGAY